MSALRGRYKRSKKASSNPYAGRGLDKFALVYAELEAKREKLAAQLGTPLSVVKFAIGSHSKWIPIIISSSSKNESQALRKAAADLIREDKPGLGARISGDDPALGGPISEGKTHMGGLISEGKTHLGGLISEGKTHLGGLISEGKTHLGGLISEDKTSLGGLVSQEKSDQGKNRVINSDSKEGGHIAADEEETEVYQRENSRYLMAATAGVLWVVKTAALGIGMAIAIASNVVMLRWHAKSMVKSLPATPRANLPKEESAPIAHPSAAMSSPNPAPSSSFSFSPLNTASSSSSLQAHLLSLPTPPAPLRIASKNALSVQVSRERIREMGSPHVQATKQHSKCQVKGIANICSAPSTPRDSRRPSKLSAAAGGSSLCDHTDIKEERSVQMTNSRKVLSSSTSMVRKMASKEGKKERSEKLGQALAAAGLVSVLGGLMMGYSAAILGVVIWWYALPSLRKAVGDKPFVRSHHHNNSSSSNKITLHTKPKGKKTMTGVGSGKYDLQSQEYTKKVIMEGLLHRG